jgi:hypothetical protein
MQETHNDACLQIDDTKKIINELGVSAIGTDVRDEHTKEKKGLLKLKRFRIRIKLEVAKPK